LRETCVIDFNKTTVTGIPAKNGAGALTQPSTIRSCTDASAIDQLRGIAAAASINEHKTKALPFPPAVAGPLTCAKDICKAGITSSTTVLKEVAKPFA
jgi:hypothetical protein